MENNYNSVGEPSKTTLKNLRRAWAHSSYLGEVHIEWKAWTGYFYFIPFKVSIKSEFWNEGPVWWTRMYWLSFGVSLSTPLPERRKRRDAKFRIVRQSTDLNRRLTDGVSEAYARRTSED